MEELLLYALTVFTSYFHDTYKHYRFSPIRRQLTIFSNLSPPSTMVFQPLQQTPGLSKPHTQYCKQYLISFLLACPAHSPHLQVDGAGTLYELCISAPM
jgi:hypothetical protein